MKQLYAVLAAMPLVVCMACFAQVPTSHANDWKLPVTQAASEPTDEASINLLRARGEIFDKFSPASPTGDPSTPNKEGIVYSPGSIGRLPGLPVRRSDAIVVGVFSKHLTHLSPSGKSVYTEILFTPTEIVKPGPGDLHTEVPFSILQTGGAIRTQGKVLRSPVAPEEFGLIPNHSYILFLRYNVLGQFYEAITSWDVTTGIAVPNSSDDAQLAHENRSLYAGMTKEAFVTDIKAKLATR